MPLPSSVPEPSTFPGEYFLDDDDEDEGSSCWTGDLKASGSGDLWRLTPDPPYVEAARPEIELELLRSRNGIPPAFNGGVSRICNVKWRKELLSSPAKKLKYLRKKTARDQAGIQEEKMYAATAKAEMRC
ncbi:hypothetical protein HK102_002373 [Quaeritorhiza haematococci]|nr:hypothetical protein HK102_002373 [Quaeritorhiza haematococci]